MMQRGGNGAEVTVWDLSANSPLQTLSWALHRVLKTLVFNGLLSYWRCFDEIVSITLKIKMANLVMIVFPLFLRTWISSRQGQKSLGC